MLNFIRFVSVFSVFLFALIVIVLTAGCVLAKNCAAFG